MKRVPTRLAGVMPFVAVLLLLTGPVADGDCPAPALHSVLAWIARTRAGEGLWPLVEDPLLREVATRYARELADRGVLSHRDVTGGNVLDRLQAEGGTTTLAGEILGSGPGPVEVCAAWASSGGHRSVTLEPRWTHVGAGCATRGRRQVWVVVFAARRISDLRVEAVRERDGAPGRRDSTEGEAREGYLVSGTIPPAAGRRPFLLSGLERVEVESWNADTGEFLFRLGVGSGERYQRLGFVEADGSVTVTDAFYPAGVATSSPGTAPR